MGDAARGDAGKDQTYFLFGLTQDQLARTLFPLGSYTKPEVRQLAREMNIPVAEKSDSQEICFVPNGDYAQFIEAYFREKGIEPSRTRGEIVTSDGKTIGEHAGVHRFTVGQRRGLGIAAPEPLYVIQTDPASQRVVVGRGDELLRSDSPSREVLTGFRLTVRQRPSEPRSRFATSTQPHRRRCSRARKMVRRCQV